MAAPLKLFVLNYQPVMRHGLRTMVEIAPALQWVGEAADVDAALRGIAALPPSLEPDVVLLETAPGGSAAGAVGALHERLPGVACVLVCGTSDPDTVRRALATGARGCLPRSASVDELQAAAQAASDGRPLAGSDDERARGLDGAGLTPREAELLALMARGLSNTEIAANLAIGLPTVKFHVAHILAKLQSDNRTEAVLTALRHGIVRLD